MFEQLGLSRTHINVTMPALDSDYFHDCQQLLVEVIGSNQLSSLSPLGNSKIKNVFN